MSPDDPAARRSRAPVAIASCALVATLGMPGAVLACRGLASVDLYDRNEQRALEVHPHRGRHYVVGQPGHEYAIRIRNCSAGRVLAVVSVDGVNVVTGETASPDQSGYVLEPGAYVNIQGWRKDLERTAAFYFSDPADAYASRTGRPDDLGVVGVALFEERERRQLFSRDSAGPAAPAARQESAASEAKADRNAASDAAEAMYALGTGHGRREYAPAERVAFERASRWPSQRVVIRYDRYENLVALGVIPRPDRPRREPDPFPAALGFVPDP
jgi:hypothetical protein